MYLQLNNLHKRFGQHPVVKGLHLGLNKGQILCLLGSSGCGKTTTLKMIAGLLAPDDGAIIIDGQDVTRLPPEARPVSTVFQAYALFPNMTVLENVTYGLRVRRVPKKEAEAQGMEYLGLARLEEYAKARVFEISGGQQQRVALMRSLILKPKVLLLDEPLSNLDAKLRVAMRVELKELRTRFDLTMVFVTHDREEAMVIADQVAVMNDGQIVQTGPPQELYDHPRNSYVMEFLGEANALQYNGGRLLLRPEDLYFSPDGPIEATVLRQNYYGFYREYLLETPQGRLAVISTKDELHPKGARVRLAVRAQRALTPEQ